MRAETGRAPPLLNRRMDTSDTCAVAAESVESSVTAGLGVENRNAVGKRESPKGTTSGDEVRKDRAALMSSWSEGGVVFLRGMHRAQKPQTVATDSA